jgi:rubrerythrin
MVGAICKLEILSHPVATIECFGWAVFFRAVFSGRDQTFLSLLSQVGVFQHPQVPVPDFIGHCITLERRTMRIYQSLSLRYARMRLAREFFNHLAEQEDIHAELLELCRAAASRGRWKEQGIETWRQILPDTERLLREEEVALDRHDSLADSLRLVIRVESSQINGLFTGIVTATDARFAKVFGAFRTAVRDHLGYIQERIPVLEPSLKQECNQLQVVS